MLRYVLKKPASHEPQPHGLFQGMTVKDYMASVSDSWFASQTSLALQILGPPLILENGLSDTVTLRGILVAGALKLVPWLKHCPNSKRHGIKLLQEMDRGSLKY